MLSFKKFSKTKQDKQVRKRQDRQDKNKKENSQKMFQKGECSCLAKLLISQEKKPRFG
jgi:hypothetical protein